MLLARLWEFYRRGGDIILFVSFSLFLSLFIGQEQIVAKGSSLYWALVIPAILLPAIRLRQTLSSLFLGSLRPIAIMGIVACVWLIISGDFSVLPALFLIVWVAGWAARDEAVLSSQALISVFLVFYAMGIVKFYSQEPYSNYAWMQSEFVDTPAAQPNAQPDAPYSSGETVLPDQRRDGLNINAWGILPHETAPTYGVWRVSATPNIVTSGILSLILVSVVFCRFSFSYLKILALGIALYFTVFSFVRSANIGIAIFLLSMILFSFASRYKLGIRLIFAYFLVFFAVISIWIAPHVVYNFQNYEVVSRLLLRGQSSLTMDDIYRQVYRPWLWSQHLQLFLSSDFLMGRGSDIFVSALDSSINLGHQRSDSVSFPTRLLATYGLPALGFLWYICERCYHHARVNDVWAISMLSVFFWLMMTWGSVFHPSNAIFVLAIMFINKGSQAIKSD